MAHGESEGPPDKQRPGPPANYNSNLEVRGTPPGGVYLCGMREGRRSTMARKEVAEMFHEALELLKSHPFLLLTIFFIGRLLYKRYASSLRSVPGPFTASFTRLWKLRQMYKGDMEKTNIALHRKYGPVVRIAPNEVSLDDPEAVKVIYGHATEFIKAPWYWANGGIHPETGVDLFTDMDEKRHSANRRKVANAYSMTALVEMEQFVDTCSDIFMTRLGEFADSKTSFDLGHWLQCYAFDVVGEITFAKRFGFLDKGEDINHLMKGIEAYLSYSCKMGMVPEFHYPVMRILETISTGGPLTPVFQFTAARLEERKEFKTDRRDFLSRFLKTHAEQPDQFTMIDVLTNVGTVVGAGSDTTAISLRAMLYYMLKNPSTMRKLQKEIEEMEEKGLISDPVTYQQSCKMPYLQAVMKEAMRLHPATGLTMARVVPKGGAYLAGRKFNEGTIVGINSWVAHRNSDVFGADVDKFIPERWLVDDEHYKRMDRYFMAFGMGSRTCVGKNISLMEMAKVIPQIVRNFDLELTYPKREWTTTNHWFVKQTEFLVNVSRRK